MKLTEVGGEDGKCLGLCPIAGFDISSVEPLGSATTVFISFFTVWGLNLLQNISLKGHHIYN